MLYLKSEDVEEIAWMEYTVRTPILTVDEYLEREKCKFNPDFDSEQRERIDNLVDFYNKLCSRDELNIGLMEGLTLLAHDIIYRTI